jgi:hypothetical protein
VAGADPRPRTAAHDPEVRPCGSWLASASPIGTQPLRSCSKLQLTMRLPNDPCPGGREVGPPWAVLATAGPAATAGPGASLAELISQVARIPANTTEAMTTAMAAPAGPPRGRRGVASWRPRGRSGCSGGPGAGRARRAS